VLFGRLTSPFFIQVGHRNKPGANRLRGQAGAPGAHTKSYNPKTDRIVAHKIPFSGRIENISWREKGSIFYTPPKKKVPSFRSASFKIYSSET
jgi:hypothetical protein